MRAGPFLLALTLIATTATTTETAGASLERMAALPDLVGVWTGAGTIRRGPGEPQAFVGEERVDSRLGGRLLVVEGRHLSPDREQVVHHAFAVLSWDEEKGEYRFRTYLASGHGGEFAGRMEGDTFIWEIPTPSGTVRYAIDVEGDTWHEVGSMQSGARWVPFFEMTLTRDR